MKIKKKLILHKLKIYNDLRSDIFYIYSKYRVSLFI